MSLLSGLALELLHQWVAQFRILLFEALLSVAYTLNVFMNVNVWHIRCRFERICYHHLVDRDVLKNVHAALFHKEHYNDAIKVKYSEWKSPETLNSLIACDKDVRLIVLSVYFKYKCT